MRFSLIFALVGLTLLVAGCGDFTYGRTIEGEVVQMPGQRFKATKNGAQQKFSVKLKTTKSDSTVDEVAKGPSGTIVECLSTRCGSLNTGECHRFECKHDYRWFDPDVIACKHDKEIECPAAAPEGS